MKTAIAIAGSLAGEALAIVLGATLVIADLEDDSSDQRVEGDGYSYTIPAGWQELSKNDPEWQDLDHDTIVAATDSHGTFIGVTVEETSRKRPTEADVSIALRIMAATTESGVSPKVHTDTVMIDGEPAVRGEIGGSPSDKLDTFVAYLVRHEGKRFMITFLDPVEATDTEKEFEELVDSWKWEQSDSGQPA